MGGGRATSAGDGSREEAIHSTVVRPPATPACVPANSGRLYCVCFSSDLLEVSALLIF